MHQQQGVVVPTMKKRTRTVGDMIPALIPILLAVFQLILFLAIIGLEAASVYYDAGRGTVYAGFWCALSFLITYIAMFSYTCCKRWSACGICLLLQNILSATFAIILIAFTARFISDPCRCYGLFCKIPNWDSFPIADDLYFRYDCIQRTREKLPVLKGLLSCAVLMLVSNLIFIIVYIIGYILLRKKLASTYQTQSVYERPYQSPPVMNTSDSYELPSLAATNSRTHYYDSSAWNVPAVGISNPSTEIYTVKF